MNTGWSCSSQSHKNQVEIPCAASPLLLSPLIRAHILSHIIILEIIISLVSE